MARNTEIQWVKELKEHVEQLQEMASICETGTVLERRPLHISDERVTEWQLVVDGSVDQNFQWVPVDWRYEKSRWNLYKPSWMMLPGSQFYFLTSPVFETLYAGTRGPGKTLTLLMDFAKDVGQGWGRAWRGVLFRRHFGDLDDAVRKIEDWFSHMFPGFRFLKSKSEYMAVWPSGEALLLRHMRNADDYGEYHGHEYPWIGWEELTEWEDDQAYRLMMSCCRPTTPGVPLRIRATTNPYGPGHCIPYGDVLTPDRGWVDIRDMASGDEIVSARPDGTAYVTRITGTMRLHHDGPMVSRVGRGLHMEFTENHRLPHLNTAGDRHDVKPFWDLPRQAHVRRTATAWEGEPLDYVEIERAPTRRLRVDQPFSMAGVDYAELMGWYLAEGSVVHRDKAFSIAQKKAENRNVIADLLDRVGFKAHWTDSQVVVYSPSWYEHMREFGVCREKYVPVKIKRATADVLRAFFDTAMAGDGCWHKVGESGEYYTTSEQLADDVSDVAVKLGYRVYVSNRQRDNREGPIYIVSVSPSSPVQLNSRAGYSANVEKRHFSGEVYCVTVPDTETFFVRQNGCVWLSGNSWVKKRFRLPDHYGQVIRVPGERERVAIQGQLYENFLLTYADPSYPLTIVQAARNPAQAQAWIEGDWNVTSGGMIDDIWDPSVHVIPDIPPERIPRGWKITRAYDHGQSHPFSVGWFLESNGEPIEIDGVVIGRVRGDRILWREWYGTTGETNSGVRMPARKIGRGIADREEDWGLREGKRTLVVPGPADTEIFNRSSDREGKCPADDMAEEGVHWERADKSSGSRKRGWEMMRTFLEDAKPEQDGTRERPGFFACKGNTDWLALVPPMPRDGDDPDDIPGNYEDHSADMTRYFLNWALPGMWKVTF